MTRMVASFVAALAAASAFGASSPVYVCPDVPTSETVGSTTLLPWGVSSYDTGPSYANVLTIPGNPHVDALVKLDRALDWLLSFEEPTALGGALPAPADPRDLVRYDGASGTYAPFFCGGSAVPPIAPGVNVDAALLDGGDDGALWLSFDVPATIGSATFEPSDLVAYRRTGPGCSGWSLAGGNPVFDASAAGTGVALSSNLIGAEKIGAKLLLTFDVPTDLGPPATTYLGHQIVARSGGAWSVWVPLAGWPPLSNVDGLAWVGSNPGRVPLLTMAKAPGQIVLSWTTSCASGGTDYGIYQGTIGSWYSHGSIACTDTGSDLTESIAVPTGNRYFLAVPENPEVEGSYGMRSGPIERPVGSGACAPAQVVTACP